MFAQVGLSVSVYLVWCIVGGGTTTSPPPPDSSPPTFTGCVLPGESPGRKFCSLRNGCAETCHFDDEKCLIPSGSTVLDQQVKVVCAPGYGIIADDDIAVCSKVLNKWYPNLPARCLQTCPPLKSHMLLMTCRRRGDIVDCSKPALPETTVSFECAPNYSEYPDLKKEGAYKKILTCNSGEWSGILPQCKPETCPPLKSDTLLMTCRFGPDLVDCSKPVLPETTVSFECPPNHSEYPDLKSEGAYSQIHTCNDSGEWSGILPQCKPETCPPLKSDMLLMTCRLGTDLVDCSKPALPETTVSFKCAPNHSEYPNLKSEGAYSQIHTCRDSGKWSGNLPPCKPACGVLKGNNTVLNSTSVDGKNTSVHLGFLPWHAGLYQIRHRTWMNEGESWHMICGGSLINKWFILTAAHCVRGSVTSLRVALGKYNQSWDVIEPTEQRRNVSAISVSQKHYFVTFSYDIGLVMLSESVRFNEYIMPICFDNNLGMNKLLGSNLNPIGSWKPQDGKSSDVLIFNSVTVMSSDDCRDKIPGIFPTFDKFCGVSNTSGYDSDIDGTGVTTTDKDGLHYMVGINSLKYKNIFIFTNVSWSHHKDWIESETRRLAIQHALD